MSRHGPEREEDTRDLNGDSEPCDQGLSASEAKVTLLQQKLRRASSKEAGMRLLD